MNVTYPLTVDELLKKYSDNFQGLGCLEGYYKIEINLDIKPVQQHARRVLVPLIGELKKKLHLERKNSLTTSEKIKTGQK